MRVVLSTIGKFHTFDLARELSRRGLLHAIYTGYPMFKLRHERLPHGLIHTHPWLRAPYMVAAGRGWLSTRWARTVEHLACREFDHHVARELPDCEVFIGLSGAALRSGRAAQARGARYICDRGSSHIAVQDALLREEHSRWQLPCNEVHPRMIETEEAEYAAADLISVPSSFSRRSFEMRGVPAHKLEVVPYGVDLTDFYPTAVPASDRFDVLFAGGASLRKGVPDLLDAFHRLKHPRKQLLFAGAFPESLRDLMQRHGLWGDQVVCLGHLSQPALRDRMSRSHVLVLPSIEDGFGLVMAQAMACACPVIASEHTGAEDLFPQGSAGFIVPPRRSDLLAESLQRLADAPELRALMAARAQALVSQQGGWTRYGDRVVALCESVTRSRSGS